MLVVPNSTHHDDHEQTVIVEDVYEEEVDQDIEEMLHEHDNTDMRYDEEDRSDGDEYGGMSIELYGSIVDYLRRGIYPADLNQRTDRSASSHWRSRCSRFKFDKDKETLLYCNPASQINDQPKVVVKKGEVFRVLERIHELIGHLGQKRTQMVVLKKLYWRSVRQDVKTYIMNCAFCNQKKLEGKKILKAPVDITSDHFGIQIHVNNNQPHDVNGHDRLSFSLLGYNEEEVHAAAMTRMTTYTFKETTPDLRANRFPRKEYGGIGSAFRRQPYIKRSRFGAYATSYILPYAPKGSREEAEFILYHDVRSQHGVQYNGEDFETVVEELVESRPSTSGVLVDLPHNPEELPGAVEVKRELDGVHTMSMYESAMQRSESKRISANRMPALANRRKRSKYNPGPSGIASRFNAVITDGDRLDLTESVSDVLSPIDVVHSRPEMLALAPIMLMPTLDAEVVQLQKELLTQQLRIQSLQEKVLQSQYDSMRIPIARYEEIDNEAEQIEILAHAEDVVLEEGVELDQELNVMDSGDEDLDQMKAYS